MTKKRANPTIGRTRRIATWALLVVVAVLFLLPLVWMMTTSIKPRAQSQGTDVMPTVSTLDRMQMALADAERNGDKGAAAALRTRIETETVRQDRLRAERTELEESRATYVRRGNAEDRIALIDLRLAEIERTLLVTHSAIEGEYWRGVGTYARDNYREVWTSPMADFPLYLKNSLIVALLSVIGMTLSSAVVAYGFSRIRWRGRGAVFAFVLATMMIPFPVLMAPLYVLFRQLGWIGTFKPLWVPAWFGGAFSIFLLRQFFMTIPRRLDEAAMLDGCSHVGIFCRIILPLAKPALVVVALFQFITSWNDFVGPLIYLNHQDTYTLALGLFMYQSQHGGTPWNLVMAASILTVLPVIVLFVLAQRTFIEGIATQGIRE